MGGRRVALIVLAVEAAAVAAIVWRAIRWEPPPPLLDPDLAFL